jgi:SAM-dependent methyltransferase
VLKFWLIDDLYAQPYGRMFLNNLAGTPQYLRWLTGLIRPHLGDTVLEVGAGIGTLSGSLMGKKLRYVAGEREPLYLHALKNRFLRTPNVEVRTIDPATGASFAGLERQFETALCINVLEFEEDPAQVISSLRDCLAQNGRLVVLVPQGPGLMGTLDLTLGHRRRFTQEQLIQLMEKTGFVIERRHQLNKISTPVWWFYGKLLGSRHINKLSLKVFDKTVWIWRRLDWLIPWRGLSLVVVARKA